MAHLALLFRGKTKQCNLCLFTHPNSWQITREERERAIDLSVYSTDVLYCTYVLGASLYKYRHKRCMFQLSVQKKNFHTNM